MRLLRTVLQLTEHTGLVRFVPRSDSTKVVIGQPVQDDLDVGSVLRRGDEVLVEVFSGTSILTPGEPTGAKETVERILSPLAASETGTIRCIGLNVCYSPKTQIQN